MLNDDGETIEVVRAELWSEPEGGGWSGDLLPARGRTFAAAVRLETGARLRLRLPSGRAAVGEIERVRHGDPAMVRVGGQAGAPFG